ncbi:hypothetical protein AGMMS5026_05890 [Endomicrobiia bacterium]|nr:hypothetical protein AGMMS49523_09570 [Endomicrobiia bacterium]GHT12949.1 hypothetical protein AGMMS49571_05820 [Endomicrobiia bacterium]GHT18546.1 hypothetical protein AGMMS49929_00450 [Endomicrobiia bacterium]GHT28666.1 hypothetical protein AGMMS49995_09880 [Endomicrobiia bacterium]GHT30789.1 hypothetical protein AGMMS5026_05890 [Endomicrobiia bacterium]
MKSNVSITLTMLTSEKNVLRISIAIQLEEKISFEKIQKHISQNYCVKHVSLNFNKDKAEKIFKDNVITYFPSYRYESPGYLNDPYEINLEFKKRINFQDI